MSSQYAVREAQASLPEDGPSTITLVVAEVCLVWYIFIAFVCTIGYVQIFRYYSSPGNPVLKFEDEEVPEVTIIRPVKGLEPYLYECLASTFRQLYTQSKMHVRFCISSRHDPAFPTLVQLVEDFGHSFDVQILVEDEDYLLRTGQLQLGPNPKIRNVSRAYRESLKGKTGAVWIADCNVWIGMQTLSRMVSYLQSNKLVHQLPLVVDTTANTPSQGKPKAETNSWWSLGGGRLEEMSMATAHAKFYIAINTVSVAPCTIGKSTMFRPSDLDSLTGGQGIDYFSYNICEDQLMGDLLWKQKVPAEKAGDTLGKHALCFGDLAIQPMAGVSVSDYWSRRVRWLRVRKFTVTLATFVEPGTESFFCSAYGAFAVTTLPFFNAHLSIPQSWTAFFCFWLLSVTIWCAMDWMLYRKLHSADSIFKSPDLQQQVPAFVRPHAGGRRPLREWIFAWLGREALALPLWVWAFWGGTTVEWRGKRFWVGMDMRVHEIVDEGRHVKMNGVMDGRSPTSHQHLAATALPTCSPNINNMEQKQNPLSTTNKPRTGVVTLPFHPHRSAVHPPPSSPAQPPDHREPYVPLGRPVTASFSHPPPRSLSAYQGNFFDGAFPPRKVARTVDGHFFGPGSASPIRGADVLMAGDVVAPPGLAIGGSNNPPGSAAAVRFARPRPSFNNVPSSYAVPASPPPVLQRRNLACPCCKFRCAYPIELQHHQRDSDHAWCYIHHHAFETRAAYIEHMVQNPCLEIDGGQAYQAAVLEELRREEQSGSETVVEGSGTDGLDDVMESDDGGVQLVGKNVASSSDEAEVMDTSDDWEGGARILCLRSRPSATGTDGEARR